MNTYQYKICNAKINDAEVIMCLLKIKIKKATYKDLIEKEKILFIFSIAALNGR